MSHRTWNALAAACQGPISARCVLPPFRVRPIICERKVEIGIRNCLCPTFIFIPLGELLYFMPIYQVYLVPCSGVSEFSIG